jgi:hypothetical protein
MPEWRLFGSDEDMLTDFDESYAFEFIAPAQWRLLEMKFFVGERGYKFRVWVRDNGNGGFEGRKYGSEGE